MCSIQSMKRKKMSGTTITVIAFISQVAEPNVKAFSCSACFTYIILNDYTSNSPMIANIACMNSFMRHMYTVYDHTHVRHTYFSYGVRYEICRENKLMVWQWYGDKCALLIEMRRLPCYIRQQRVNIMDLLHIKRLVYACTCIYLNIRNPAEISQALIL